MSQKSTPMNNAKAPKDGTFHCSYILPLAILTLYRDVANPGIIMGFGIQSIRYLFGIRAEFSRLERATYATCMHHRL